jgi:hypothetical protein
MTMLQLRRYTLTYGGEKEQVKGAALFKRSLGSETVPAFLSCCFPTFEIYHADAYCLVLFLLIFLGGLTRCCTALDFLEGLLVGWYVRVLGAFVLFFLFGLDREVCVGG